MTKAGNPEEAAVISELDSRPLDLHEILNRSSAEVSLMFVCGIGRVTLRIIALPWGFQGCVLIATALPVTSFIMV